MSPDPDSETETETERESHPEPGHIPKGVEEEPDTKIERVDTGYSVTTTIQRGNGTDDRDKIVAKVKEETREEAEAELEKGRPALREHLEIVRTWQPDQDDEEGA